MKRTQKNKATEGHLGHLKAKLAKLRTEVCSHSDIVLILRNLHSCIHMCRNVTKKLLEGEKGGGGGGEGDKIIARYDWRIASLKHRLPCLPKVSMWPRAGTDVWR